MVSPEIKANLLSPPFIPEGPAVTGAHRVTMATRINPAASVFRAAATATLTPRTPSRVTTERDSVSSACTTRTVRPAPTVSRVITATLWPTTADVSEQDRPQGVCVNYQIRTRNNTHFL